jgi:hypothetical protein
MKAKKAYNKPQLTQVRLVVQTPVLANCNSLATSIQASPATCNFAGADCADTAGVFGGDAPWGNP